MAHELGIFEGKVEVASKVVMKNAGDGLSKPLAAAPRAWQSGERVPILCWGTFGKIGHDPVKEGPGFIRVHDFATEEAIVLDQIAVSELDAMFESQRLAVQAWEQEQKRLKDEAKGITSIPFDPEQDEIEGDGSGESLPEIDDESWEASARESSVSPIGSKRAAKGKG